MYYRIFTRSLQTDTLLPHCTQQTQLWVATVKLLAHSYLCCNSTTAAQFRIRGKTTELVELLDVSKLATKQTKHSWNKVFMVLCSSFHRWLCFQLIFSSQDRIGSTSMDLWKSKENCVASSKDKESSSHIVHPGVTVNFEFYFWASFMELFLF